MFLRPRLALQHSQDCLFRFAIRLEIEEIINGMPEVLFTAEIAFGGQNRCVPKQELNLLQLSAIGVTQLRTRPS